ncbi:MAG: membrane protein insertase YidC [Clostridiales bacterium]|nr:membrane protein insertase YidC [Clostridiales bacterium]
MPQVKKSHFVFALLAAFLLCSFLVTPAAAGETAETSDAAGVTLSPGELKNLGDIIAAAKADAKAEDTRTPRDMLTAAFLAGDLPEAVDVIKKVNTAQSTPVDIDYDALTLADIEALVEIMKTEVSMEKPGGFFAVIQLAAGSLLNWLTQVLGGGNYIIGLAVFALLIEALMLPLTVKQQKNSIKFASLKPKEAAIRKKYAGREDKVTKNKMAVEIQEMYQKEGYNPFSGCLPMFIQLPIIFILYYVVVNPIVYVMKLSAGISEALTIFVNTSAEAGGLGAGLTTSRGTIQIASLIKDNPEFIEKLSKFQYFSNSAEVAEAVAGAQFPNFNFFGLNFGLVPDITNPDWLLIIPVLTFLVSFLSMKLTRKLTPQPAENDQATGCSNNIMDIGMPAFSAYICFIVPAALGFYWMVKNLLGTASRLVLAKVMPLPVFTEEDYKAAEREILKGKTARPSRPGPTGKPVRSLHHIDDEDFEDTRAKALERKARLEAYERELAEQQAAKKRPAGMKNEDDRPMRSLFDILKGKKKTSESAGEAEKPETPAQEETAKPDTEGQESCESNPPADNTPKNPDKPEKKKQKGK